MRKFGLIGYPLAGSGSPELFRRYCSRHGIGDTVYELVETPDFEDAMRIFRAGFEAVNVTAPFKTRAAAAADLADESCRKTGAANILVRSREGIKAFNSDYLGVLSLLGREFPRLGSVKTPELAESQYTAVPLFDLPEGPSALVVGTGGAGRAAAVAALDAGFASVTIANRTLSSAAQFAFDLSPLYAGRVRLTSLEQIGDNDYALAVYALPCAIPQAASIRAEVVIEANYRTPCLQKLLPDGRGCGKYISGNEWLIAQAEEGYPLFFE